jgi:hypothetical protein
MRPVSSLVAGVWFSTVLVSLRISAKKCVSVIKKSVNSLVVQFACISDFSVRAYRAISDKQLAGSRSKSSSEEEQAAAASRLNSDGKLSAKWSRD